MKPQPYSAQQRNVYLDEFITPKELAVACVSTLSDIVDALGRPPVFLDVGANTGVFGYAIRTLYPNSHIIGVELMKLGKPVWYDTWIVADAMELILQDIDIVLGNPPYKVQDTNGKIIYRAEDFVHLGLKLAKHVSYLLRSGFRHGVNRHRTLFSKLMYSSVHELSKRPSFYRHDPRTAKFGTAATNRYEYSLFTFDAEWRHDYAISKYLQWDYAS